MLFYGIAVVLVILLRPNGLCGYREFSLTRLVHKIREHRKKDSKGEQPMSEAILEMQNVEKAFRRSPRDRPVQP